MDNRLFHGIDRALMIIVDWPDCVGGFRVMEQPKKIRQPMDEILTVIH